MPFGIDIHAGHEKADKWNQKLRFIKITKAKTQTMTTRDIEQVQQVSTWSELGNFVQGNQKFIHHSCPWNKTNLSQPPLKSSLNNTPT